MTLLGVLTRACMVAAAVTAAMLARRRADYRPAAVTLAILAAGALLGALTDALLPWREEPWQGGLRLVVYLDGARVLAEVAAPVWLALVASAPKQQRLVTASIGGAWLAASAVLGALYPSPMVRGAGLQRFYLGADLTGLAVSTIALVGCVRRALAQRESLGATTVVALFLVALDVTILLVPHGPWRDGTWLSPFGRFDGD